MAGFHYTFRLGDLVRATSSCPYTVLRDLEEPMEVVKRHKDGTVNVMAHRPFPYGNCEYSLYDYWVELVSRETCEPPKQSIFEALYT